MPPSTSPRRSGSWMRHGRSYTRLEWSLAIAIVAHLALAALVNFPAPADALVTPEEFIEILPIEEDADEDARRPDGVSRRIVEIPEPLNEQEPDDARYVSEKAQTVPEEHRSRVRSDTPPAPSVTPADESRPGRRFDVAAPVRETPGAPDRGDGRPVPTVDESTISLKDLFPSDDELRAQVASSSPGQSDVDLDTRIAPPGSRNFLPELSMDNIELLNAKSVTYASFVRRVAYRVFDHFLVHAKRRTGPADWARVRTFPRVDALMSPAGKLVAVKLVNGSEVRVWDDCAVDAVRDGVWDKNVPVEALTDDGYIHFVFIPGTRILRAGIL